MSRLKTVAIAAVGAVAGVTLWQWLSDDPVVAVPRVEVVKEYVVAPPSTPEPSETVFKAAASALVAPTRLAAPAFKTSEFGRELLEAKDVKMFVIDALKHPERGGAYYAALALNPCSRAGIQDMKAMADRTIQKIVATESTVSQERMDAINAALVRCAAFSEGEVAALYAEASRHGLDGTDPLYALNAKLRSDPPDEVYQSIFESGSWALISRTSAPTRLLQAGSETRPTGTTYRFNGNTYTGAEAYALLVGSRLGTCVDGDYCDLDEEMRTWCRALGTCYASREEYVRQRWFQGDQAAYDKAAAIGDEIRSAIARGDRSIFH